MSDLRYQNIVIFLYGGTVFFLAPLFASFAFLIMSPLLMPPRVAIESEAENTINSIVRTQQDYFLDRRLP